jgi:hypothetical protein
VYKLKGRAKMNGRKANGIVESCHQLRESEETFIQGQHKRYGYKIRFSLLKMRNIEDLTKTVELVVSRIRHEIENLVEFDTKWEVNISGRKVLMDGEDPQASVRFEGEIFSMER